MSKPNVATEDSFRNFQALSLLEIVLEAGWACVELVASAALCSHCEVASTVLRCHSELCYNLHHLKTVLEMSNWL